MNINPRHVEGIVDKITESQAPVVVLGVGIPASGKSTLFNAIGSELGIRPINVDRLLNLTKSEGWNDGSYDRFRMRVRSAAVTEMRLGGVALIDAPHCHFEDRREDASFYRSVGARTIGAVVLDSDPQLAIQRDGQRPMSTRQGADTIIMMHQALVGSYPDSSEGLDWIERIHAT